MQSPKTIPDGTITGTWYAYFSWEHSRKGEGYIYAKVDDLIGGIMVTDLFKSPLFAADDAYWDDLEYLFMINFDMVVEMHQAINTRTWLDLGFCHTVGEEWYGMFSPTQRNVIKRTMICTSLDKPECMTEITWMYQKSNMSECDKWADKVECGRVGKCIDVRPYPRKPLHKEDDFN